MDSPGEERLIFHSAMDSHPEEAILEHAGLESPEDFQFDPDCTLILYGLHGRNTKGLLKKFLRIGTVTFWQPVQQYDTAIVAYATPDLALEAKNTLTDEKILFCTVRDPFCAWLWPPFPSLPVSVFCSNGLLLVCLLLGGHHHPFKLIAATA